MGPLTFNPFTRAMPLGSRRISAALLLAAAVSGPASADGGSIDAALRSMSSEIADVRKSCNDPVAVAANEASLSDRVRVVHVVLTSPVCLGQWGKYDYLLVKDLNGRWRSILGGPGPIHFSRRLGSRFARIDVSAMMGCELSFTWNGSTYIRRGSQQCAGGSKGVEWSVLERVMRAAD